MAGQFYRERVDQHLRIGVRAVGLPRRERPGRLHCRRLRSVAEAACQ
jgi:AMP nucleosidase